MKTIAEEPVQHTGECGCYRNSNSNTAHCIGYHHCIPAGGDTTTNYHGAIGVNYTQASSVPGNHISVTVSSPVSPTGDSTTKTCRECNNATGVTATITTRKKVNNNKNLNAQDNRRQRYIYPMEFL